MTTHKEALKLALEALESFVQPDSCEHGFWWEDCPNDTCEKVKDMKAITAIKEALAHPEQCKYGQEPKSCTSSPMDCQCAIDATLAQPEQEPVGEVSKAGFGDYPVICWRKGYVAKIGDKFYTTPPQRKPLTYVDLRRIANQCGLGANGVSARTQATVDNFARAIEAEHGIKE